MLSMEEKVIIIGKDGLPTTADVGWTDHPKIKKPKPVDNKRAKRRLDTIERRKQKKTIDVTHPWKKQFFKVKNIEVKNPERLILKKVTNDYEGKPTKKHR